MSMQCSDLSLPELERDVRDKIELGRFGDALDAIRQVVDVVINNPRSVARVLASSRLDSLCQEVASAVVDAGLVQKPVGELSGSVILATELAVAGGHVEVIKDFIRLKLFDGPVRIVLTDCFARADPELAEKLAKATGVPVLVSQGANSQERFRWLLDFLNANSPKILTLMVHNQDTLGIVAALAGVAERVYFVHHGDHHLSLGVTCEQFRHVDVSNTFFHNCRHNLGIKHNLYWPMTLATAEISSRTENFLAEGGAVTCAAGRKEKFSDGTYLHNYFELIGKIIATTKGRHVHIGALDDEQLAVIYNGLALAGVKTSQFKHVPWVPSVARALIEENVDVYLTSFPQGGGKSMIEAMAAGIPIIVHRNYRSRVLSGIHLGYDGIWNWGEESELISILTKITPALITEHSARARAHFETFHNGSVLTSMMGNDVTDDNSVKIFADYHLDGLQAFLDEETAIEPHLRSERDHARIIENEYRAVLAENVKIMAIMSQLEVETMRYKRANQRLNLEVASRFSSLKTLIFGRKKDII